MCRLVRARIEDVDGLLAQSADRIHEFPPLRPENSVEVLGKLLKRVGSFSEEVKGLLKIGPQGLSFRA